MKKKAAFFLALIIALTTAPLTNVSAASTNHVTRVFAAADDGWVITNNPALAGMDMIADAVGSYLSIEMLHNSISPGDEVTLVLNNAVWNYTNDMGAAYGNQPSYDPAAGDLTYGVYRPIEQGNQESFCEWELRFHNFDKNVAFLYFPNGYSKGDIALVPLNIISTADDEMKTVSITNTGNTNISPSANLVIVTGVSETGIIIPDGIVTGKDVFAVNRVRLVESRAGTFISGQFVILAPEGYIFDISDITISDSGSKTGVIINGYEISLPNEVIEADLGGGNIVTFSQREYILVNINITSSSTASVLYISGLRLKTSFGASPAPGVVERLIFADSKIVSGLSELNTQTRILGKDSYKTVDAFMAELICGDVNDDGVVDMLDSILLARYIAEWGNVIDLRAADVNDDGVVDMIDAIILARHIAEWPGYETLPLKP